MAISSVSNASVNLYSEAARAGRGERRERGESHECNPCAPQPAQRGSVLADAMRDAFEALGWSRPEANEADEAAPAAASRGDSETSLDDAVAGFASALAQALKDVRRADRGGAGEGHCGRGWGHGRGHHGMAPRIQMLVVQVQASAPAEPATPAAASATPAVAAPAPAPEPMTIDTTPETPTEAQVNLPIAEEGAAVEVAAQVPGETEPLDVAPPPPPEEPERLVDAFKNLLDSLRDNGVQIPAEESAADSLVRFLNQLAESLRGRTGASRFDTMPVFSGAFVRIVV